MKGPDVHADSAAGYCPSKTFFYSENIMIQLHIFSSQLCCTRTHTHPPTSKHTPHAWKVGGLQSWRWWALGAVKGISAHHLQLTRPSGTHITEAANMKVTNS